ncbi:DMT family transporter [Puniceibacterium confluentis]|uniref:DMT family transporter n=1 Tax=Puniceibacterium confluentis TaxID=1958944 RepID=UPI001C943AB1|nr:EamA family transporter [Puniceibacterium confluentis]
MNSAHAAVASERATGIAACLLAATAWGTTGTAATFAPDVSAVAIGSAAMGLGGLMQALFALRGFRTCLPDLGRNWILLFLGAVSVAIYPLAFYAAMRFAGVTVGTVIAIGSAPLFSALIENRIEGSRLTPRWAIGAGIGITGMALLSVSDGGQVSTAPNMALGVGLGLVAAATYALYSWTARRLMRRGVRSRVAMGATFGLGGLFLMPVLFATGGAFLASATNFAVGAYMAIVPMFLGYIAYGIALARIPTRQATTITLFEPVVAAMLAVLVVEERLSSTGWLGAGLIVACLFWMELPKPRR